jgi:L-threonylcarbamoyladenylate synthase
MTDPTRISRIVAANAEAARSELERCVRVGGVAVFPADTVYGLGCDPSNAEAIDRIRALKDRAEDKPSAVMFFSPLAMRELVATLGSRTRDALAALLPGPVTVVVHNPERRYPLACGSDPERLGVRLIEGPLAGARCPLFQTSANRSGEPDARSPEEIDEGITAGADLVVTAGELIGTPSSVVDVSGLESGGRWRVLREGAMPHDELARRLGRIGH